MLQTVQVIGIAMIAVSALIFFALWISHIPTRGDSVTMKVSDVTHLRVGTTITVSRVRMVITAVREDEIDALVISRGERVKRLQSWNSIKRSVDE